MEEKMKIQDILIASGSSVSVDPDRISETEEWPFMYEQAVNKGVLNE